MKLKSIFVKGAAIAFCAGLFALPTFAQDADEQSSGTGNAFLDNTTFYITADFAYYPASAAIPGTGDIFAPITGGLGGLEGRVTGHADYKIATPLSDNPLMAGDNVTLGASFELTPVSVKPGLSVSFTPIAFLVFSAGAEIGSGWDFSLMNVQGMGRYNGTNYDSINFFNAAYYKFWAQGTFQFDTGAIFPGDWTHVVMMASYQVNYQGLAGVDNKVAYKWQGTGSAVNGWQYYSSAILAYQMPLVLYRAGVMAEFEGHFSANDYENYASYGGDFMTVSIAPLVQFQFDEHNQLAVLFGFSSRRRFTEAASETTNELSLTNSGREWYFKRVAFSYTYTF